MSKTRHGISEEQQIAADQLEQLREHPERTARISVRAGRHPWVRYEPPIGMFEIAEVSEIGNIEVEAVEKDALVNLFAENPVNIKPLTAALFSPPQPGRHHLWKHVDERLDCVTYVNPQDATDTDNPTNSEGC
jgi:hypothetical protein